MSKYAIRRGHQRTGNDGCAEDILNEIDVVNAYYQYIIDGLKAQGHEVLDVTPPENCRSLSNSLMYGVNMANTWGADYFISCHANSCDRTDNPVGCEVVYLGSSTKSKVLAESVDIAIASLGLKDRGAKADVRGLCELRNTDMPCIIIEPFFISSQADVDLFNSIGAESLGNAIVGGITGQTINSNSWKQGWNKSIYTSKWFYCTDVANGYYYKNQWAKIDERWYHFDKDGYMQIGWLNDNGDWFYLNPISDGTMGVMKIGWIEYKGEKCYLEEKSNGNQGMAYQDCKATINGKEYQFDKYCYLVGNK